MPFDVPNKGVGVQQNAGHRLQVLREAFDRVVEIIGHVNLAFCVTERGLGLNAFLVGYPTLPNRSFRHVDGSFRHENVTVKTRADMNRLEAHTTILRRASGRPRSSTLAKGVHLWRDGEESVGHPAFGGGADR